MHSSSPDVAYVCTKTVTRGGGRFVGGHVTALTQKYNALGIGGKKPKTRASKKLKIYEQGFLLLLMLRCEVNGNFLSSAATS